MQQLFEGSYGSPQCFLLSLLPMSLGNAPRNIDERRVT
jgi:hypothetical protein